MIMRYRCLIFLSLLFLACADQLVAQDKEDKKESVEEFKPHSTIGVVLSHAHIFAGKDENGKKNLFF